MASVISDRADQRAELSVWRSTGAQVAYLAVSSFLPPLVFNGKNVDAGRFGLAAIVMAALAVVFYFVRYFNVAERVHVAQKPAGERQSIGKLLASLATNRALLALVVAALLLLLGNLFNGTVASFLWLDYFGNGAMQGVMSLAATLPAFALIPVAGWLTKRFGKTEVGTFGVALYVVVMVGQYLLHTKDPVVFIVLNSIAAFGLAIFNFLVWAFIVDVIDYQEVRTGERDDATTYAIYSWARKVGQAASIGLGGIALAAIGYKASTAGGPAVQQTPETIEGIWMLFTLVPALFLVGTALSLFFWYPLKKKQVEENTAILAERHAANA